MKKSLQRLMSGSLVALLAGTMTSCVHALERREITWEYVEGVARGKAEAPWHAPNNPLPEEFNTIGYDAYRDLRFNPEKAFWKPEGLPFQMQLFHRGYLFRRPVRIHEFSRTHVQRIPYVADLFNFGPSAPKEHPGSGADYAGFRIHAPINRPDYYDEVISFIGASYFRAVAREQLYGLSARGLALHPGADSPEEFPHFTQFWIGKPLANSNDLLVYALLESPSVTGAYSFLITPGEQTKVEVKTTLFAREAQVSPGLAPLTSMFWFGEYSHPKPEDFRSEVHDSDGMFLHMRNGEQIWRPLDTTNVRRISVFDAESPVSFGLLQRDRDFAHYQDIESSYHRRPSLLIFPNGDWGAGKLHLLELPPDRDFIDNIVAWWEPETALRPNEPYSFSYTMLWGKELLPTEPGRVMQTRMGKSVNLEHLYQFIVEFSVPDNLAPDPASIQIVSSVSNHSRIIESDLIHNPVNGRYRASLLVEKPATGTGDVELRAHLQHNNTPITETWNFRWTP